MNISSKILLSSLLLIGTNAYASDKDFKAYDDFDAGSVTRVNDIKSQDTQSFGVFSNLFYLDVKSNVGLPNLKFEYNNNTYSKDVTGYGNNNYINNEANLIDVNLHYGDAVSYYTIKSESSIGINVGAGVRQYIGDVKYKYNNEVEKDSFNSTIPLTYIDVFYEMEDNKAYIGFYNKESQLKQERIQESGIYLKKKISGADDLSITASYSLSSMSLSKGYDENDYSGVETSGLNLQLKYSY